MPGRGRGSSSGPGAGRRFGSIAIALAGFLSLGAAAYYVRDYVLENQALERFAREHLAPLGGAGDAEVVEHLTGYLGGLPGEETTAQVGYLNPLYRVLKAKPVDVLRYGGFCGNKSRLLLTLLRDRGIDARLMYMFNPAGAARPDIGHPYVTAFLEVDLGGRWSVADPYIGVLFRRADGLPATASDLADDPALVRSQAPRWYSVEIFNYREIRGIRWGKFPLGETLHDTLARLFTPARVNSLHYPWWVQRPNLLMALAFGGVALCAFAVALRGRARAPRPAVTGR